MAINLKAIERAAVAGWPASETEVIDGWLVRASSGGSVRANSVSALDYTGSDIASSIRAVVAAYRARGAEPAFTMTEADEPADLDATLAAAGWIRKGEHVTMAKPLTPTSACPAMPSANLMVEEAPMPSEGWMGTYLEGLSENRRAVAPGIVARVPMPRVFFTVVRGGCTVASGLSVVDGRLASVQCMATLPEARRAGAASAILAAIERNAMKSGVQCLYLQADAANAAALALYERNGFSVAGRYHTRVLKSD